MISHFYDSIPGHFTFETIYREQVANAKEGAIFVEVGAWKGRSTAFMATEIANSGKTIHFYVVDMWDDATHLRNAYPWPYEPATFAEFTANLRPVQGHYTPRMGPSVEISREFPDASLDFCWIDADHSLPAVRLDIAAWLPKIKPGGVIAGHDYEHSYPGVMQAVDEAFANDVEFPKDTLSWLHRVAA